MKPSENLVKLKVVLGYDMSPSINPKEVLLLDKNLNPEIGDVIVFKNRLNLKIAHRLICKCGDYYFTKGDNCQIINFPCRKDNILGVVVNKNKKIKNSFLLKISLCVFLINYLLYCLFHDVRRKDGFLLLTFISKYIA